MNRQDAKRSQKAIWQRRRHDRNGRELIGENRNPELIAQRADDVALGNVTEVYKDPAQLFAPFLLHCEGVFQVFIGNQAPIAQQFSDRFDPCAEQRFHQNSRNATC